MFVFPSSSGSNFCIKVELEHIFDGFYWFNQHYYPHQVKVIISPIKRGGGQIVFGVDPGNVSVSVGMRLSYMHDIS